MSQKAVLTRIPRGADRPLRGGRGGGAGLCQMHALNAYLGQQHYTPTTFAEVCRRYDDTAGLPTGTSHAGGPLGFIGDLDTKKRDPAAPRLKTLLHFAVREAGDPFDESLGISAMWEAPDARRVDSRGRPIVGAFRRPRFDPAVVAKAGVRAVFVFNTGHIWVWRYCPDTAAWYRIDDCSNAGNPAKGDPSKEWNGPHGVVFAVPRSYRGKCTSSKPDHVT